LVFVKGGTKSQVAFLSDAGSVFNNESSITGSAFTFRGCSGTIAWKLGTEIINVQVESGITGDTVSVVVVALAVGVDCLVVLDWWGV